VKLAVYRYAGNGQEHDNEKDTWD